MTMFAGFRPSPRASALRAAIVAATATLLAALLLGCGSERKEGQHPGKAVYLRHCFACHQAGVAGAPKLGDAEAWAPRIAQGRDAMLANVVDGMTPGMPPRGACPSCDDKKLSMAVDYMVASIKDESAERR